MNKIFLAILTITAAAAFSEAATGNIGGRLYDKSSMQPLAGGNIYFENEMFGASSDSGGYFIISKIEPGSYTLIFQYQGYATQKVGNVIVNPKRTTILEIGLQEKIESSEAIETTASFFEKPNEATVSSRSMNFEEIRRSPGDLVDIQRVVHALPSVVSGSDQLNEIIIRGGYPGENLFILDNIEIPNPNHFAIQGAGGGQINLLNSYMVRNLDFYAGAFSAKYGDKASSVLELFLRDGSRERFRGEGSMGMAGMGILMEGPLNNSSSFMFSARKSFLDLIVDNLGLTAVPKYYSLQGKVTYDINSNNRLLLNAIYGADNINFEDEDASGVGRGAENVDTHNSAWISGATLKTFWNRNLFSNTTLSAVRNDYFVDVYEKPQADIRDTFFKSNAYETEVSFKSDFVYKISKDLELSTGASYKNINFNYNTKLDADTLFYYFNNVKSDSIFRANPEDRINKSVSSIKNAFYGQLSFDLLKNLRLNGGLRFDYFDYTGFSSWSPRLGLSYYLTPRTSVNLAYGKHYQAPAYVELVANSSNRKLRSKYTQQYVLSIEHLLREDIQLISEVYYKTYHDVPVKKVLTTQDPFDFDDGSYLNAGEGRSIGFEMFFQKKLTDRFSTIISYAHSLSEAKDARSADYYNWDYDYQNVFTFISGYKYSFRNKPWYKDFKETWWHYSFGWLPFMPADEYEISSKFRYLGGRPFTPPTPYDNLQEWVVQEQQLLNTERYPAYQRLDIRLDRRLIFDNWTMVIFFDLNNIFNRDNIWSYQYSYNDDGTRRRKKVLQYKTLPVGGLSIEF